MKKRSPKKPAKKPVRKATKPAHTTAELTTVRVPDPIAPLFAKAQDYVRRYFEDRQEDPSKSRITISGERYILVRAASMSVEFFDMVMSLYKDKGQDEARAVANNILFDIAHAIGKADARVFHARMKVVDPIERLSAGPIHFSFSGWAFVDILPDSRPSPDEDFYLIYNHPFSFESDAWMRMGRKTTYSVCIMNAGYSSGWCEESFGLPLVSAEVECQAKGDPHCRFIMAPPHMIEEHLAAYFRKAHGGTRTDTNHRHAASIAVPEFFQRKRMEEELRASKDELEERVRERTAEVMRANEQLRQEIAERIAAEERHSRLEAQLRQAQKMEAVGRLAGGVAHDFNNLLMVVRGQAELALMDVPSDAPFRGHLEEIISSTERGASLTSQLLTFSRRQVLQPKTISIKKTCEDIQRMLPRLIGETISVDVNCPDNIGSVRLDPNQFLQVLINLAVNARDAMPQGGRFTIQTENLDLTPAAAADLPGLSPGPYVLIAVRDTGKGMPLHTQAHVFEPFFTTKEAGKGSGLGLAIVHGIIRQAGGHISFDSAEDKGTVFRIYLPRVPDAAAPEPAAPQPQPRRGRGRILVVEDEGALRTSIHEFLTAMGYSVTATPNGASALAELVKNADGFDLVLSDAVMPEMSGTELFERIQRDYPGLKLVLMSGYSDEDALASDPTRPSAAFLQKPFSFATLADLIAKALTGYK